jgi:hypothetical protein
MKLITKAMDFIDELIAREANLEEDEEHSSDTCACGDLDEWPSAGHRTGVLTLEFYRADLFPRTKMRNLSLKNIQDRFRKFGYAGHTANDNKEWNAMAHDRYVAEQLQEFVGSFAAM